MAYVIGKAGVVVVDRACVHQCPQDDHRAVAALVAAMVRQEQS